MAVIVLLGGLLTWMTRGSEAHMSAYFLSLLFFSFFPSLSSLQSQSLCSAAMHGGSGRGAVLDGARRGSKEAGLARGQGSPAGLARSIAIVCSSLLRALAAAAPAPAACAACCCRRPLLEQRRRPCCLRFLLPRRHVL